MEFREYTFNLTLYGLREFESGLMSILVGFLPSITARKPIAARNKVAKAFETYYNAGGVQKGSALAQMRYQAEVENKVALEDIARYEVGGSVAILVRPQHFGPFFYSTPTQVLSMISGKRLIPAYCLFFCCLFIPFNVLYKSKTIVGRAKPLKT